MEALRNGVLYTVLAFVAVMIAASVVAAVIRGVTLLARRMRHGVAQARAHEPIAGGPVA
ncbi:MAG: hypothetical protein IT359_15135 [Gemmatimonadaceae bacterium]|nr:hypothetical protein [Gemmatimonadaceae bacterium]